MAEDYDATTPQADIDARPWFGRCVYEADNDVCDDQTVTLTWDAEPLPLSTPGISDRVAALANRGPKRALFHMVASTQKICERYSKIYGADGEVSADSETITVTTFQGDGPPVRKVYKPHLAGGGHGGGDDGLARQFVAAVDAVKGGMAVGEAQRRWVGCTLEEVVRSHAVVFAAEEARKGERVVRWREWWEREVEARLRD